MEMAVRPNKHVQALISHGVPSVAAREIKALPSLRCHRLYGVHTTDGSFLLLALPPPLMVKLLRSEQGSISSEAAVLKWLAALGAEGPPLQERTPEPDETQAMGQGRPAGLSTASCGQGDNAQLPGSGDENPVIGLKHISKYLPQLLANVPTSSHSSPSKDMLAAEYNVTRPPEGVPLSDLIPPASSAERRSADFQMGQFCRRLCRLVSPTSRFGPAFAVLPPTSSSSVGNTAMPTHSGASRKPAQPHPPRWDANARMIESRGVTTWATAFHSMLEAVLRDGEDMAVMLGYAAVRRHFQRLEHVLDAVTCPRLVAVDTGDEGNMLVVRKRRIENRPRRARGGSGERNVKKASDARQSLLEENEENESDFDARHIAGPVAAHSHGSNMVVTGMKDWSNFVFGDPLFATAFCYQDTSGDFLRGFNDDDVIISDLSGKRGQRASTSDNHGDGETGSMFTSRLIEDPRNAPIRLLLYGCYHTITHIVKEFYRPQRDSGKRELAARKRLTNIMAELEMIDGPDQGDAGRNDARDPAGQTRVSSPKPGKTTPLRRKISGEMSPSKRARSEEAD